MWNLHSSQSRSNPNMTGFNLGCIDQIDVFDLQDIKINDGKIIP